MRTPPRVIRVFINVSRGGHKYAQVYVLLKHAYLHVGFFGSYVDVF